MDKGNRGMWRAYRSTAISEEIIARINPRILIKRIKGIIIRGKNYLDR